MEFINSPSICINKISDLWKSIYTDISTVYSPVNDYETSLKTLKDSHKSKTTTSNKTSSSFVSHNRSVLRLSPIQRNHHRPIRSTQPSNNNRDITSHSIGMIEFDYNFVLFSHDIKIIEQFEMMYISNISINRYKTEEIVDPTYGNSTMTMNWQSLSSFDLSRSGNDYKSISGSCIVNAVTFIQDLRLESHRSHKIIIDTPTTIKELESEVLLNEN